MRASGGSLESLALKFRGHKDAIWRHWRDHVSADLKTSYLAGPATIAALKERAVAEGGSLLDQLCSFAAGSTNSPDRLDAMVWAFTQLMVGAQNDGIIRFYVEDNARLRSEWSVGAAGGPRIRIEAPPGISCVQVKSGRSVAIPEYRIVELDDFDAKLLVAVGWRAIDPLSA